MKKSIRVFYHSIAFVCAFAVIFLSLVVLSIPHYLRGENKVYSFNDVLKAAYFDCDVYNVSVDNLRQASESETDYLKEIEFRYIPNYKCIDKMLFFNDVIDVETFFVLAYSDNESCVVSFSKIRNDTFAEVTWIDTEDVHKIKHAYFLIENFDYSKFDIEPTNAKVTFFNSYVNPYFGISNIGIFVLSISVVLIFQYIAYKASNKKSDKNVKNKK